jgi:N-acetyltransferase
MASSRRGAGCRGRVLGDCCKRLVDGWRAPSSPASIRTALQRSAPAKVLPSRHYTRRDVRPRRLPGADRPEQAPEHREAAQGAPHLDPLREPRPAPGPARVAGGGGPRAQARDRTPGRLLLRAQPAAEDGPRGARCGGGVVLGTHARWREAGCGAAPQPLVLRVSENGASWHADVGFSRGILEPIPFGPGPKREQSGWSFRVVEDGPELVLQKLAGDEWVDVYGFLPQPVPRIDMETSNWWTSTHPGSLFVTGLIVGIRGDDGTSTMLCELERAIAQRAHANGHEPDAARARGHTGAACHALLAPRLRAWRGRTPCPSRRLHHRSTVEDGPS